ncbi:MAG: hypothetical protein ABII71_02295 [Candidatus Micrarchaeota archaeon]
MSGDKGPKVIGFTKLREKMRIPPTETGMLRIHKLDEMRRTAPPGQLSGIRLLDGGSRIDILKYELKNKMRSFRELNGKNFRGAIKKHAWGFHTGEYPLASGPIASGSSMVNHRTNSLVIGLHIARCLELLYEQSLEQEKLKGNEKFLADFAKLVDSATSIMDEDFYQQVTRATIQAHSFLQPRLFELLDKAGLSRHKLTPQTIVSMRAKRPDKEDDSSGTPDGMPDPSYDVGRLVDREYYSMRRMKVPDGK